MPSKTKPYRCGYSCDCLIDPLNPPDLDTCSYGGGHQSTALLVLAAREQITTRTFLFCNVGDDSEHPGTLEYVATVAAPYAAFYGLEVQTLTRQRRDGTTETLIFCPFHRPAAWADLARETPDLFDRSVALEDTLNERRAMLGKDPVFLTRFGIPLREAIDTDQPLLTGFDDLDGSCDSGYCFT